MFRRRREASFQAPASSAWWPAGAGSGVPGGPDPDLGGSGVGGSGVGGSGVGSRPGALPSGDPFGGWPAFPVGSDPTDPVLGQPAPLDGWGTPVAPKASGGLPGQPATAGPSTGDASEASTSWMPLLTHADDGQPFQASPENPAGPDDQPGADLTPATHPEPRRVRAARRRAARASRTADQQLPEPDTTSRSGATTHLPPRWPTR